MNNYIREEARLGRSVDNGPLIQKQDFQPEELYGQNLNKSSNNIPPDQLSKLSEDVGRDNIEYERY